MDRLIKIDDAIYIFDNFTGGFKSEKDLLNFRKMLEDVAIPSAEPKWIPVSERLPKEGEDVLACFYTGEGNYKMMVSRRSDYNYWNGVGRTADMVAWIPLPKPYEPQESEE